LLQLVVERKRLGRFAAGTLAESEPARTLWSRMNVPNWKGAMSAVEWRIANLYQVVVLQKRSRFMDMMQACAREVAAGPT
jgi:hypothetical protein